MKSQKGENLVVGLYFGTAERSFQESVWHAASQFRPYNPDDLVQRSQDYSIYEDMLNDDQISVCQQIKRDLVIGSGWDLMIQESEDQLMEDVLKDVEKALTEDTEIPFDDQLEGLTTGYDYGFANSEKIFKTRDDGSLTLRYLKTRHPATWLIHTDEYGNIEKFEQRGVKSTVYLETKSILHYVNAPRFGNPYGRSDLRSAYNAWFVKRQVIKYYAIYLEKASGPIPIARYDTNIPNEKVTELHNTIKSFQAKTALTIPKAVEVEFLESKTNGEAFHKAINIFNMFIGRALLIPDLLGFQGAETGGGSYQLGKSQMEVFFKHIQRRRVMLEQKINDQIIKPIVIYNWGFQEKYPKFKFRPISDDLLVELAKLWIDVVKGKVYSPNEEEINHFRKLARFPEGAVEFPAPTPAWGEETHEEENDPDPTPGSPAESGAADPKIDSEETSDADPGEAEENDDEETKEKQPKKDEAQTRKKKIELKRAYPLPIGDYHKKVDFKAIESHMDRFKSKVMNESTPIVRAIFEDLFDQIEQKKIVKDQKPERIESIKLKKLKDLKLILKRNFREAYGDAQSQAASEIMKGHYRTPLPDDKFLEFLESETFQYIGDWSYQVTKKARLAMLEAIKDGKSLSSLLDLLEDEGLSESMVSIERFARTKFTDVTNRGRLAFFNESGLVSAYQYSAILDDRTSDVCSGLDGKIFKAGTEPIPPMHFNCRSLLIPITRFEEYEADTKVGSKPIDQFIEENKGAGFPKR